MIYLIGDLVGGLLGGAIGNMFLSESGEEYNLRLNRLKKIKIMKKK